MRTVAFVSNYINHHQIPFSEEMRQRLGDGYAFIQTEAMEEERVRMGWDTGAEALPYVHEYRREKALCERLLSESDVVIYGGAEEPETEALFQERVKSRRLSFRYSERIYKTGQWKAISPRGLCRKYREHTRFRRYPVYLLCAGGYVASDFHLVGAYPGKMLRWGYFPETKTYDMDALFAAKEQAKGETARAGEDASSPEKETSLLWAGRMLDWKHPETPLYVAKALKEEHIPFRLTMLGNGVMEDTLRDYARKNGLEGEVSFIGAKPPQVVREYMEKAEIFLLCSDYREGWGAVLNEAMNAGCAAVVSKGVGAEPFLYGCAGETPNMLPYASGDVAACLAQVKRLVGEKNAAFRRRVGESAYRTITALWNEKRATEAFCTVSERLLAGKEGDIFMAEGPCSRAALLSPGALH